MYKLRNKKNNKKGFVLLFAVLISSLVLAVGISVINISVKQIKLSGSGRESQFAFYAANTGAECAYYWDIKGDPDGQGLVFATSSDSITDFESVAESGGNYIRDNVVCMYYPLKGINDQNGDTCTSDIYTDKGWCIDSDSNSARTKFRITYQQYNSDVSSCADVIVEKTPASESGSFVTTVTSRGYNTCDETNPRRIERALVFTY